MILSKTRGSVSQSDILPQVLWLQGGKPYLVRSSYLEMNLDSLGFHCQRPDLIYDSRYSVDG